LKILILKPSSLGDVIHALPVLRLLKKHWPHAEIYWWLASSLVPLLEGDPDLAGIIPFARHRWKNPADWPDYFHDITDMRRHHFDLVIDLQGLARSGLFAWLANGDLTIGIDTGREGAHGMHDISIPRPTSMTHAVDWYLEILRVLQVPVMRDYVWLPGRTEAAASIRSKWPIANKRWIILNPGARWNNKRWPIEYYAALVRRLSAEHQDLNFAVTGASSERELGEAICREALQRCLNLTGETSLSEMIEWIRVAQLMVTNDTGPMHVAAALGKPVVALFGPTDPSRTGPYGQIARVLKHPLHCAPCMKSTCHFQQEMECLRAVTPEAVLREVKQRMFEN
jgi:heptosyltransferase-1